MDRSRYRTALTACLIIMLCVAMLIGGTYALWTKDVSFENHLTAGKLDVKLERISLTKTYLDQETGYLTSDSNNETVDFSGITTRNVFDVEEDELIVPCSAYSATLKLTNNGDVAFTYEIIVKLTSQSNELAEQLKVYVSEDDGKLEDKGFLSTYALEDGKAIIATQSMAKNDAAKVFTVKIEFVNDNDVNNAAQSQQASFDLMVNAVQQTNAQ